MFKIKKVQESSTHGAYLHALKLLSRTEYSQAKLVKKLKEKGFDSTHIEDAIADLVEKKYLCDDRYSDVRAKQLMQKGFSISYIHKALAHEGLSLDYDQLYEIQEYLGLTEEENLNKALLKKRPDSSWIGRNPEAMKNRNRAIKAAIMKGFDYQESQRQLSVILHQLEQDNNL
jgi:SOS response regulatory protein OraA/RecX